MVEQKPRQGWIYIINPARIHFKCKSGHGHFYDLNEQGELECKTPSCSLKFNSSRVFRGEHPYIIWTGDDFQDKSNYLQTFTVIPLTSQETFKGLSTTYPINPTSVNGLYKTSYALIHQIITVDANCLKNSEGKWSKRIGQLDKTDKENIEERLKYFFNIQENPTQNLSSNNVSPEVIKTMFSYLSKEEQQSLIDQLIEENF